MESALSFQNVHQFTQPIISSSLVVFTCVIGIWSLLNEFLGGFDFVFEFLDLGPQIVGDRSVGVNYELFSSWAIISSILSRRARPH